MPGTPLAAVFTVPTGWPHRHDLASAGSPSRARLLIRLAVATVLLLFSAVPGRCFSVIFNYTADQIPQQAGWLEVGNLNPSLRPQTTTIEDGVLRFSSPFTCPAVCDGTYGAGLWFLKPWSVVPGDGNVVEFRLRVVSAVEEVFTSGGLGLLVSDGAHHIWYLLYTDKIRPLSSTFGYGADVSFDTSSAFNTYTSRFAGGLAELHINGQLVLSVPAGVGTYFNDGAVGVAFGDPSSYSTVEALVDEVRAYERQEDSPPVALCQSPTVNTLAGACNSPAEVDAGSFDPDNDDLLIGVEPIGPYGLGDTVVTLTAESSGVSACAERPTGAIAWWPGDGTTEDIVGGNDGTLELGAGFAAGLDGQAFQFDGIDDIVLVPESPELDRPTGSDLTIETWLLRTSGAATQHLMGKRSGCGGGSAFYQLAFEDASGSTIPLNEWTHFAFVHSGPQLRVYVNAVEVGLNENFPVGSNDADLTIGNSGTCSPFQGLIDEVVLYDRALSEAELQGIVDASGAGFCKDGSPGGETTLVATCEGTVSVVDPEPPTVLCNAPSLIVTDGTEERFTATAGDNCQPPLEVSIEILGASCMRLDLDGDGVPDDDDECPNSELSDTLVIAGCNTGVDNIVLGTGCSFADLILDCAEAAQNHGAFVSCLAHLTNDWKAQGLISGRQKGAIQRCAAKAPIPPAPVSAEGQAVEAGPASGGADDADPFLCEVRVQADTVVFPSPPRSGRLAWTVRGTDGSGNITTQTCEVRAHDPDLPFENFPPIANAGLSQSVLALQGSVLDGSASADPDGDPLTYNWTLVTRPPGSAATLSDSGAVQPTFTPDRPGQYRAALTVSDGVLDSVDDTVTVTARNNRPIANAGPGLEAFLGETVTLDGTASLDPEGDALGFSWMLAYQPEGSTAGLSDPNAAAPAFLADVRGVFVGHLVVDDGEHPSLLDHALVRVLNQPPTADAGPDREISVFDQVELNGGGSHDPDGDPLSFRWSFRSRPPGSSAVLSSPTSRTPSFIADFAGVYDVELVVNDGFDDGLPDTVSVVTVNTPPVAKAGTDQSVLVGDVVQLDGSGSSDVDADLLAFSWTLSTPPGSGAALSDPASLSPTFTADLPGDYVVQLVVNDGQRDSVPDTIQVTALLPVTNVPNVVGLQLEEAEATVSAADLVVGEVVWVNSPITPVGTVIAQVPSAGAEVPEGSSIGLTVSGGPAVVIQAPSDVLLAGDSLDFNALAFDTQGNPILPTPAFSAELDFVPEEVEGTPPTVSGFTVFTNSDTRGGFVLRVTFEEASEPGILQLVVLPDDEIQAPFGALAQTLASTVDLIGALEEALAEGDFGAVQSLLAELSATRDTIDLEVLRRRSPLSLEIGFLPTLEQVIAAGHNATAEDMAFVALTLQSVAILQEMEVVLADLDPSSPTDQDAILDGLNHELDAALGEVLALDPSVNGMTQAASTLTNLLSVRLASTLDVTLDSLEAALSALGFAQRQQEPTLVYAVLRGTRGSEVKTDLDNHAGLMVNPRLASFNLTELMIVTRIRMTIIKKVYAPLLKKIAKYLIFVKAANLGRDLLDSSNLAAIVTGASQSFHVFNQPYSWIEGIDLNDFSAGNDVYMVGPEVIDTAFAIVNDIESATKTVDVIAAFRQLRAAAQQAADAWDQANSRPDSVAEGCIFSFSSDCRQLIYENGFKTVHTQGFLPAPVFVVVRNVTTNDFASIIVQFIPSAE